MQLRSDSEVIKVPEIGFNRLQFPVPLQSHLLEAIFSTRTASAVSLAQPHASESKCCRRSLRGGLGVVNRLNSEARIVQDTLLYHPYTTVIPTGHGTDKVTIDHGRSHLVGSRVNTSLPRTHIHGREQLFV